MSDRVQTMVWLGMCAAVPTTWRVAKAYVAAPSLGGLVLMSMGLGLTIAGGWLRWSNPVGAERKGIAHGALSFLSPVVVAAECVWAIVASQ